MTARPDLPAWATERPLRPRQYVIGTRRCRQRMAQALGQGMAPGRVAAVNRLGVGEVEILLRDASFQSLVGHYAAMAAEEPEARLAKLRRLALDLLELALQAGDVRVAIFFAQEDRAGRDPSLTLARAAIRVAERLRPPDAVVDVTADPGGDAAGEGAGPPPPRPKLPRRQPAETRRESEFPYCAATLASEAEAAALAADEARRFAGRLGQTRRRLTTGLLAEAEREGTATAEPPTQKAEAFARQAHGRGGEALDAAARWQARREAFAAGRVLEEASNGWATMTSPSSELADPVPRLDRGIKPGGDEEGAGAASPCSTAPRDSSPARSFVSSPGSTGGPAGPMQATSGAQSALEPLGLSSPWPGLTRPSRTMPAEGGHPPDEAAGTAAPSARDGPAPPTLPDWLDRVPGASRPQLLAMKPEERAVTLRTIARFYGFDTS